LGAENSKNIHERTKILLTNIVIFGIKNACYMKKEKELWDSLSIIESYLGE